MDLTAKELAYLKDKFPSIDINVLQDGSLHALILQDVKINTYNSKLLRHIIEHSPRLNRLVIRHSEFNPEPLQDILEAVSANQQIRQVKLTDNKLGVLAIATLIDNIPALPHIRYLDLSNNPFGDNGVKPLLLALRKQQGIELLHLANASITDNSCAAISRFLSSRNVKLNHLNLSANRISNQGVQELSRSLEQNRTLQWLDLSANCIENEGTTELADALMLNTSLRGLILTENNIGEAGISSLLQGLAINKSLVELNLTGNQHSATIAKSLAELDKILIRNACQRASVQRF